MHKNSLVFDLETNQLLEKLTTLHCVSFVPLLGGADSVLYYGNNLGKGLQQLQKASCLVGHNIIGFDLPALFKLGLWESPIPALIDTLVVSRLLWPERPWGHSLAGWGRHLGFPKGEYSDWSVYTAEMGEYCKRDVEVTRAVYNALLEEWHEDTLPSFKVY